MYGHPQVSRPFSAAQTGVGERCGRKIEAVSEGLPEPEALMRSRGNMSNVNATSSTIVVAAIVDSRPRISPSRTASLPPPVDFAACIGFESPAASSRCFRPRRRVTVSPKILASESTPIAPICMPSTMTTSPKHSSVGHVTVESPVTQIAETAVKGHQLRTGARSRRYRECQQRHPHENKQCEYEYGKARRY